MTYPAPMPTPFRRSMRRVSRAVLFAVFVGALGIPSLAAPAGAADNGLWSVFPTTAPGELTQRPYFQPVLRPGVQVQDSVTITNKTDAPITFELRAVDAFNTPEGGFALRAGTAPKRDMGAWITLGQDRLELPAKSSAVVPFTIDPPEDATPGDHPGGIVAINTQPVVNKRGDVVVNELYGVGTRVYGRVQGPLNPQLNVTQIDIDTSGGVGSLFGGGVDAVVTYRVTNTGNVRLNPTARLTVSPLVGGDEEVAPLKLPELLPRGSAIVKQNVDGVMAWGRLTASVQVSSGAPATSAEATAWVIPWLLILLIILVIAGVFTYRWWRRRRAAAATAAAGGGAPPS